MNFKQYINWFCNSSTGIRWHIAVSGFAGILRVCASLFFIWVCKQLIDIATHVSDGRMIDYTILLVITVVLQLLLSIVIIRSKSKGEICFNNKLKHNLFSHIMLSVWDGKERFHSGDILNRIEEDVRLTGDFLCKTLPSIVITVVQLIAAFIFLCYLNTQLAWVVILIMPVFLLLSKVYIKRMRRLTKEIRSIDSDVQSHIQEKIQYKVLIQTLGQNKTVAEKLLFLQNGLYEKVMARTNFTIFSRTLVMAGFTTGYIVAFLWGVNGIFEGVISFGVMTAFLQLVGQVQQPIVDLSSYIPSLVHAATSADRLKELTDLSLEEQGEQQMIEGPAGIYLENIVFAFPDGHKHIIKNFSFDFVPGSRTAIVGKTGVGKSTLIRIMLALLHPQEGNVYLYNRNQRIETSPLTRCNLVYVPQGNTLLSGTIRDNLLLGNSNATDEQLNKSLETAVAGFVHQLPEGLDTICGERGTGISEGQAQRICIARGLLRPGSILLLDELSSSLDSETEHILMERLTSQTGGKTLIFITHREVITKYCDQTIKLV